MKRWNSGVLCVLTCVVALLAGNSRAMARVKVVASSTDVASIARMVGGNLVEVRSIAPAKSNLHYVEVLPSYMIRAKKADIYLKVGMGLDRWADQIIDGSRNGDLAVIDCSEGIGPLQVPSGKVDASLGDVHPWGNPHYWLNPDNGVVIAEHIAGALERVDPDHASSYAEGLETFRTRLREAKQRWAPLKEKLVDREIIVFHDNWPYFCQAFGLKVAGFVEPKPGIEPTPSHTARIINLVKSRSIKTIGVEPYYSTRAPKSIARETGARITRLPSSVGGAQGADDYFSLFDTILRMLIESEEG